VLTSHTPGEPRRVGGSAQVDHFDRARCCLTGWLSRPGAAAEAVSPAEVIAISGGFGAAMAAALAIGSRRPSASPLARS